MRITKVYTRKGDQGNTRLAGGQEIPKDALRLEAYGTIDELNSVVGLARSAVQGLIQEFPRAQGVDKILEELQSRLFDVGAILATAPGQKLKHLPQISPQDIRQVELWIDAHQKDLKPLKEFILPAGSAPVVFLHQARTVCRRAERICVRLHREEGVPPEVLAYLNRLSDGLFVLARWMSGLQNGSETYWKRTDPSA